MGVPYSRIRETLGAEFGVRPSKGQLSEWLRGIHSPLGSACNFSARPSPELAYVIGVKLGDGSLNRKGYNRRIRLTSVDLDLCWSSIAASPRCSALGDTHRGLTPRDET